MISITLIAPVSKEYKQTIAKLQKRTTQILHLARLDPKNLPKNSRHLVIIKLSARVVLRKDLHVLDQILGCNPETRVIFIVHHVNQLDELNKRMTEVDRYPSLSQARGQIFYGFRWEAVFRLLDTLLQESEWVSNGRMSAVAAARKIGHTLGNQFFKISGYAELALNELDPQRRGHYLSLVVESVKKSTLTIRNLQSLAPEVPKRKKTFLEGCLLRALLPFDEVFVKITQTQQNLNLDLSKKINLKLEIDPIHTCCIDLPKMELAFENIIQNAVDAVINQKSPRITISSNRITSATKKQFLEVVFDDNGVGVPRENQSRVFEFGFTGTPQKKAGLGLFVARKILHEHQGTVFFESSLKSGARVICRIPLDFELMDEAGREF